eukprot:NODE_3920_length_1261_cov_119.335677_g3439_i0.p1 GENE.NODE_3920_length_1261_cov_119.335677_g3439_i0~~NODE_3920_length_1261_cov_119.335677_g3439_i0.p1  ORF type:complete len:397 (+),score=51.28 NODE_3920_length_1261_cov_119.335677_g3439_i0:55-1191(+)
MDSQYTSYGGRLSNKICGACFGFVLVVIAFPLLWYNEGSSVSVYKTLQEILQEDCPLILDDQTNPSLNGHLVLVHGSLKEVTLTDPDFSVTTQGIYLNRNVEMYQWKEHSHTETRKTTGGGEEKRTYYTYSTEWSSSLISSSGFRQSDHRNPHSMPYSSHSWESNPTMLGTFRLPNDLKSKAQAEYQTLSLTSPSPQTRLTLSGNKYYSGSPASPNVGDVRISYQVSRGGDATVLAVLQGDTFSPYVAKATKRNFETLYRQHLSKEYIIEQEVASNTFWTWVCRLGGFILMWIGMLMIAGPLPMLLDFVPFLGGLINSIISVGVFIISFFIAGFLSFTTIGVAWLFYHPFFAFCVLGGAAIFIGLFIFAIVQAKDKLS